MSEKVPPSETPLKDFYFRNHNRMPPSKEALYLDEARCVFLELIDFIGDRERFNCPVVNPLARNLSQSIKTGDVGVGYTLDLGSFPIIPKDTPAYFVIVQDGEQSSPELLLDKTFISQVQKDPVLLIEVAACIASQAQDFHLGRLPVYTSDGAITAYRESLICARAYEAETLRVLLEMAKKEGLLYRIRLNSNQTELLNRYPRGTIAQADSSIN